MNKTLAIKLAEETSREFKKYTALFAGDISNAAEYVFYNAAREGSVEKLSHGHATLEIARLATMGRMVK